MKKSILTSQTRNAIRLSAVLLTVLMLSACHTVQTVSDTTANHLTNHLQRDSIYLHDSIFVRIRADTVYLEKWHTKWREKEIVHTDTIQVETTRTETVQVRYVPSFYKYCTAFAFLVLLALLLRLAWWLYRHFH